MLASGELLARNHDLCRAGIDSRERDRNFDGELSNDMPERLRKPSVAPADIYARLERIKKLWLELEKVRVRTDEYEILIEKIHAESLAYMRLVDAKRGISAKDQTSN